MKSDLYAWSYGNNSDWVELTFGKLDSNIPDITQTFNVSEDEILEIAERIKAKRNKQKELLEKWGK